VAILLIYSADRHITQYAHDFTGLVLLSNKGTRKSEVLWFQMPVAFFIYLIATGQRSFLSKLYSKYKRIDCMFVCAQ
jgi:hypothetical protein